MPYFSGASGLRFSAPNNSSDAGVHGRGNVLGWRGFQAGGCPDAGSSGKAGQKDYLQEMYSEFEVLFRSAFGDAWQEAKQ